ncbi:MAG: Integral membrane protein MviN [Parcubacteria group bacterium GW2011_GWF2_39_13b]|nr:MAG: Integral membrane protein MviN [Parcubacteria group bacterium GW2011_GWF2_39_13b]
MIKKLFNSQSKTITSAAILLGAASLISRILGLLRDRILAGKFGAGDELDIYFAAFRIPDLIYNLLVVGALTAGFIPVFAAYWNKEKKQIVDFSSPPQMRGGQGGVLKIDNTSPSSSSTEEGRNNNEAWHLANGVLNLIVLGLIIVCGLTAVFARQIVPLIAPGFNPQKIEMTINLTRLIFLSPIFLGISGVFSGILQSFKNFLAFALAPIFYNLGIIFGAIFLTKYFGIYGLGLGVVLGAFLHMLIQIPPAIACGFRYRVTFDFFHEGIIKIIKLMVPRAISLGISQLNFVALTFVASSLAAGSIAIFNFAYNIYTLPFGIIAVSYAVAVFPSLTEAAVKKDWQDYAKNFSSTFRQILFFIIPASIFLVVLRAQIVRVILGSGKFDWQDTILTIQSLQYLAIGLFADSLVLLMMRGFFAIENTKTPAIISLIGTIIRLFSAIILVKYFSVAGLALGYAIGSIACMILLWIFLEERVGDLGQNEIIAAGFKILLSSAVAGLAAYGSLYLIAPLVDMKTFIGIFIQGLFAGLIGVAAYIIFGLLMKSQEMFSFWQAIANRLPWASVAPAEEIIE